MTKNDLIDQMALNAGISRSAANKALEALVAGVSETLKEGKRMSLQGFGSWSVYERAARNGRNPRTNDAVFIPAKQVVRFKPSSQLTEKINPKKL